MIRTLTKPRRRRQAAPVIGPEDHGRRMTLDAFDRATGREGYLYELNKGGVEVVDVPQPDHGRQVQEVRDQLTAYRLCRPNVTHYIAGGSGAKLLIGQSQSERHPDLAVYLTPAPDGPDVWSVWVPEIVVEVVSKRSARCDYEDKPAEYAEFGVAEYWIVDAAKRQMTALTRWRGGWRPQVVKPPTKHATRRLPGFSLDLKRVLDAAK